MAATARIRFKSAENRVSEDLLRPLVLADSACSYYSALLNLILAVAAMNYVSGPSEIKEEVTESRELPDPLPSISQY